MQEGSPEFWRVLSQRVYDDVERRFPVAEAKNVHTWPDGRKSNMDREAMMARLNGVCGAVRDVVTGDG